MRKHITAVLLALALALTSAVCAQESKKPPEPLKVTAGDMAPDFTLLRYTGEKLEPVSLHDYRGKKKVALAFFVFAFTGG